MHGLPLKSGRRVPIHQVSDPSPEVSYVSEPEAFRTCPYCAAQDVPKLVVYPRLMSGSSTIWRCRSCDRTWSDAQTTLLRAS